MISFDNTEIAFSGKHNSDLNRSYWLFKLISSNAFVSIGKSLTLAAIRLKLPVNGLIKSTIFRQFCGGETIGECEAKISELAKFHIGTILDYSVEGKQTVPDFDRCTEEIIRIIRRAKGDARIPFSVFKITGLGRFSLFEKASAGVNLAEDERREFDAVKNRVDKICSTAYACGVPVFIDAEESWIQHAFDTLANAMMSRYNRQRVIVFNTFQLYRKDRLDYLKKCFEHARENNYLLGAKLVRGAYMEKERKRAAEKNYPSPIHDNKNNCDQDFDEALKFCTEHIDRIAFCSGSHNEKSSMHLVQLMKEKNISSDHPSVWFSQLLGMSDHISYNLAHARYNVAKYVPYGPVKDVLPYLIRRAQENTSVKGQTGRELSLIMKEKKRRREVK
jgi:proline dehydrogenase